MAYSPAPAYIEEWKYSLDTMSPEVELAIAGKVLLVWDNWASFWAPEHKKGKKNWDYLVGRIFTEAERAEYEKQDKIILEIPELVPKVNALEGMQIAGSREGIIVPVGGEDAPDTEAIGHIVRSVKQKTRFSLESTACFTNGIVAGFPAFMFFEKATAEELNTELWATAEPWDAILPDPNLSRLDLSDCEGLIRLRTMSRDRIREKYKHRRKEIDAKLRHGAFDPAVWKDGNAYDSSQRDTLFNQMNSAAAQLARSGTVYVIEWLHWVYQTIDVYVSPYTDKPEILPQEWTQQEVNRWKEFHPDYRQVQREMRVLWVTTITNTGLLLENRRHWFQEGEFPCEMYVPRQWNNKYYGVVEFLTSSLKGRNVTKIEHLHSLRMSNDDLMVVRDGTLVNPADAVFEKGRTGGIIVRSKSSQAEDISFPLNHREQLGWRDISEEFLEDINRLSVDRNFEGGTQTSQESGKAIQMRNTQVTMKYSPYLSTYNLFHLRATRKILLMIPHVWTEYAIFRYIDGSGNPAELEVNKEEGYNWATGAAAKVKNNLCGARYDYMEAEGDNSVTAKEHELNVFNEIMERQLRNVPDVQFWPFLLASVPNRMAQDFGRKLQEYFDAQAEAGNQPEPMKKTLSITGEDVLHNPYVIAILQQEGILPPDAEAQSRPPQGAAPQGGDPGAPAEAAPTRQLQLAA